MRVTVGASGFCCSVNVVSFERLLKPMFVDIWHVPFTEALLSCRVKLANGSDVLSRSLRVKLSYVSHLWQVAV